MFLFRRPSDAEIRAYLARQGEESFSYSPTCGTRGFAAVQIGWDTDQQRVLLGHREAVFQKARQAIDEWRMFPAEIATLCWPRLPREGMNVADAVYYDLLAVSRPRHWLARMGYPYTRYEQARFRRLSGAAMVEATGGAGATGTRR